MRITNRSARAAAILSAAALLVTAACGGGGDEEAAPKTTKATTTTVAPTTVAPTTTGGAPLTGLPGDPARLSRVALVVKLDNAPKGRPQAGLAQADVVVSEKVEDGVTRLFAVFQSTDADSVGPVRSARSTDIALVHILNRPLFSYSGANHVFLRMVREAPLVDVGHGAKGGAYRRQPGRPAPYNLFSSTNALRAGNEAGGPPPAWFTYRSEGAPLQAKGAEAASSAHVEYLGKNINTIVDYRWDASLAGWARSQDGSAFVDANGTRIAPKNLIVQIVNYKDTGIRDTSGSPVPEGELLGEGEAWILTDGKVVKGRWARHALDKVTTYTGPDGAVVPLTPGQTWIELAVAGNPNRLG